MMVTTTNYDEDDACLDYNDNNVINDDNIQ